MKHTDAPGTNPFNDPAVNEKHRVAMEARRAVESREVGSADAARARQAVEDVHAAAQRAEAVEDAMADLRAVMAANTDVFGSSAILSGVAKFAESRGAERFAVVSGVLLRAVLAVPPQVVLPPIIGGEVSLNLLLAVVGASGAGKGTADKAAEAAVHFMAGNRHVASLPILAVGSGEGISRTYAHSERDKTTGHTVMRWRTDRALFGARDIASMNALLARQGSTLVAELLKAYMGEELGFANADRDRRVELPMHSYRLCLSVGVQPDNATILLDDQARRDGVPQRFLWAPVRPGVTRTRRSADSGVRVDPLTVTVPTFGIDPLQVHQPDDPDALYDPAARPLVAMNVPASIAQQIIDADAAKDADPFGRSADPLAGHRLLAQLKIAAALAVLHNRTEVGDEDWQHASALIAVSTAVARVVTAESVGAAEQDAVRRGRLDGQRQAAADDARSAAALSTVTERVARYLGGQIDGQQTRWVAQGAVRRALTAKHRQHFEDAVTVLLAEKRIAARKTERQGQTVTEYRFTAPTGVAP